MLKAISKVLLIAMMLVAFFGQVTLLNTTMSCETSVNSLSPNVIDQIKHNDLSSIETVNEEDCCDIECCAEGCCFANTCSSLVYVNTDVDSVNSLSLTETTYKQLSEQPTSMPALLYRPPIFSS
jgi:hypothetical protein